MLDEGCHIVDLCEVAGLSQQIIEQFMKKAFFSILPKYIILTILLKFFNIFLRTCRQLHLPPPLPRKPTKPVHNLLLVRFLVFHGEDGRFVETAFGKHR